MAEERWPGNHDEGATGGEELSLERAEELARELGVHTMAMRRLLEVARRGVWYAGSRTLVFEFPDS